MENSTDQMSFGDRELVRYISTFHDHTASELIEARVQVRILTDKAGQLADVVGERDVLQKEKINLIGALELCTQKLNFVTDRLDVAIKEKDEAVRTSTKLAHDAEACLDVRIGLGADIHELKKKNFNAEVCAHILSIMWRLLTLENRRSSSGCLQRGRRSGRKRLSWRR